MTCSKVVYVSLLASENLYKETEGVKAHAFTMKIDVGQIMGQSLRICPLNIVQVANIGSVFQENLASTQSLPASQ